MAAKLTAADLKKHHYWILAGVAPLFALLAALFLWLNVGDAVAKSAAATDAAVKDVAAVQPKGKLAIDVDYPKQEGVLNEQKKKLWEKNYDAQKAMFVWPKNDRLKGLEKRYPKFGQKMPEGREDEALDQIRKIEVYEKAYEDLAAEVKPTAFAGGSWRGLLRYVSNWTEKIPTDKQLWLALEDLWVQRGLLLPVNDINAAAGRFDRQKPADGQTDDPLKRTFVSRLWKLEMDVPKQATGGQRLITCKLTNTTDRLQALGAGNEMRLLLTLAPGAPEVLYRIQAPLVPANQTVEVQVQTGEKDAPDRAKRKADKKLVEFPASVRNHGVPAGLEPTGVLAVRQVLDERNAPVRRIDALVMGGRAKDARHSTAEMKAPKWYPSEAAAPAAAAAPGGEVAAGGGGMPGRAAGGMPGGGGGFGGMVAGAGGAGGGPFGVLDANKERYIDVTDQVRRMPVALVLVVDQMFVQDALAAYANSPLRFQVTQYHWTRFRGALDTGGSATAGSPFGPPAGGGGSFGPPSGGGGSLDSGELAGGAGPGGPPAGYGGGAGGPAGAEDQQVTSGLVELSLYGIVTLYEKYEAPAAAGTPADPAPATPAPQPAAPPANPATPTPTTGRQ